VVCSGCGNLNAYVVRVGYAGKERVENCDQCGNLKPPATYDTYLGSKGGVRVEENITEPGTGRPIPYATKGEKAAILKRLNLREAGDRVHGAR